MFLDVDECAGSSHGCSQICKNTDGGFECKCQSGYRLEADQKTCVGKDSCCWIFQPMYKWVKVSLYFTLIYNLLSWQAYIKIQIMKFKLDTIICTFVYLSFIVKIISIFLKQFSSCVLYICFSLEIVHYCALVILSFPKFTTKRSDKVPMYKMPNGKIEWNNISF